MGPTGPQGPTGHTGHTVVVVAVVAEAACPHQSRKIQYKPEDGSDLTRSPGNKNNGTRSQLQLLHPGTNNLTASSRSGSGVFA